MIINYSFLFVISYNRYCMDHYYNINTVDVKNFYRIFKGSNNYRTILKNIKL